MRDLVVGLCYESSPKGDRYPKMMQKPPSSCALNRKRSFDSSQIVLRHGFGSIKSYVSRVL